MTLTESARATAPSRLVLAPPLDLDDIILNIGCYVVTYLWLIKKVLKHVFC